MRSAGEGQHTWRRTEKRPGSLAMEVRGRRRSEVAALYRIHKQVLSWARALRRRRAAAVVVFLMQESQGLSCLLLLPNLGLAPRQRAATTLVGHGHDWLLSSFAAHHNKP